MRVLADSDAPADLIPGWSASRTLQTCFSSKILFAHLSKHVQAPTENCTVASKRSFTFKKENETLGQGRRWPSCLVKQKQKHNQKRSTIKSGGRESSKRAKHVSRLVHSGLKTKRQRWQIDRERESRTVAEGSRSTDPRSGPEGNRQEAGAASVRPSLT